MLKFLSSIEREEAMGKQFEAGKEYVGRFVSDADTTHTIKVVRRTGKTVWVDDSRGSNRRLKVREGTYNGGNEYVMPFGTYSMAMQVSADKEVAACADVNIGSFERPFVDTTAKAADGLKEEIVKTAAWLDQVNAGIHPATAERNVNEAMRGLH